jgi:two-component system sensor histidine kinase RegB
MTAALARLAELPRRLRSLVGFGGAAPGRVRLHTVTVMRWIAVGGQLFTILFVHFSLDIHLPLAALLPAVALTAAINLVLTLTLAGPTRLSERSAAILFGYDIVQLCYLLALTGGLQNPFAILLLLPVALAAGTLGLGATLGLTALTLAGTCALALFPGDLPWRGGGMQLPDLFVLASWTALSTAVILISIFAWNSAEESRRYGEALAATQLALAREQQLSALGGQAAAAAHLLGSPLGTINVIAKELVRELPPDSPLLEEAEELLGQAKRCREILQTLGRRPSTDEHRRFTEAPVSTLLEGIAADFSRPGIAVEVEVEPADDTPEPSLELAPEMRHALANLIDNAIQFAESEVLIGVRPSRVGVEVVIEDDGPGFAPEVLDWLGEPYISSRSGKGGLGLGVFIANTLLARAGASLHFENRAKGARVRITWPPQALGSLIQETQHGR